MTTRVLVLLLAAGCSAVPASSTTQAIVRADTSNSARCGPDGAPLCEARVIRVDGRRVLAADRLAVEPGRRRLTVYCRFNLSIMIGDAQSVERELEAELGAGKRFRFEGRMQPEPCAVALVEER